jgi:hypothetical protein
MSILILQTGLLRVEGQRKPDHLITIEMDVLTPERRQCDFSIFQMIMHYLHPVKNLHTSCLRVESRSNRIIGNYLNLVIFSSIWFAFGYHLSYLIVLVGNNQILLCREMLKFVFTGVSYYAIFTHLFMYCCFVNKCAYHRINHYHRTHNIIAYHLSITMYMLYLLFGCKLCWCY